jgi:hypothetical protein
MLVYLEQCIFYCKRLAACMAQSMVLLRQESIMKTSVQGRFVRDAARSGYVLIGTIVLASFSFAAQGAIKRADSGATISAGLAFSPMDYGATGDGVANDRAAVRAAIDAAIAAGGYVDGGDKVYGSNETLQYTGVKRPWIKRLRLKDIAPAENGQILNFRNCEQVRIDSLYIHTGDNPGVGSRDSRRGLNIEGGSGHRIRNVELTGKGKLAYANFSGCKDSIFENIYVHDGLFNDSSVDPNDPRFLVEDDVVEGIRVNDCFNCTFLNPIVRDLLGNGTYYTASGFVPGNNLKSTVKAYPNMRTRGMAGGGNDAVTVINPRVSNVDQGIDFSGNGGNWSNKKLTFLGGHIFNCGSVGLKLAGGGWDYTVIGVTAENCGMAGFIVGGHSDLWMYRDCMFIGCTAINPGYNDITTDAGDPGPHYIQNAHCGWLLFANNDDGLEGVTLDACRAIDRQGFFLLGDDMYDPKNPEASPAWPRPGATSATMQFAWTGYTGTYTATFSTDNNDISATHAAGDVVGDSSNDYEDEWHTTSKEVREITLTNGSTTVTWDGPLPRRVTRPFVSMPPKMQFGFLAHKQDGTTFAFNQASRRPLTLNDNCESIGHVVAREHGFHRDVCHVTANDTPSEASAATVAVEFKAEVEDTMAMHSTTSDEECVYPKRPGIYRVRGMVAWAANGTGDRYIQVRKNAAIQKVLTLKPPAGFAATRDFDVDIEFTAADIAANAYIAVFAYQDSGGALNLTADRWMKVERVRAL